MNTPEKEFYAKLANTYRRALRELEQFTEDEVLLRAGGFRTLEEATRRRVPYALAIGENIVR